LALTERVGISYFRASLAQRPYRPCQKKSLLRKTDRHLLSVKFITSLRSSIYAELLCDKTKQQILCRILELLRPHKTQLRAL
jgi:hypothetical protein